MRIVTGHDEAPQRSRIAQRVAPADDGQKRVLHEVIEISTAAQHSNEHPANDGLESIDKRAAAGRRSKSPFTRAVSSVGCR